MQFSAIVVAAGAGLRAGGPAPKQWRLLCGRPVVRWSVEALLAAGAAEVIVVTPPQGGEVAQAALDGVPRVRLIPGGTDRIDSVRAGLEALSSAAPDTVLVHDAARPFLTVAHVSDLLGRLSAHQGAIPALRVSDTLKLGSESEVVLRTVARDRLYRAQTPQAFNFRALVSAYEAWPPGETPTDDAAVLERAGGQVALAPGDPMLMKLTYPEDFSMAERLACAARITRVGQGIDAHRFTEGDCVWLCGVRIAHDQGLLGHSDADAGLHALTDAILGATGQGDIGDHFPPTDPRWRGAASDQFLLHAMSLVHGVGGRVLNADVTLICERPKIKPHRAAMRARLAALLELPEDRVSVKATTMEEMGFTGRQEGIAAQAVVTVETPA